MAARFMVARQVCAVCHVAGEGNAYLWQETGRRQGRRAEVASEGDSGVSTRGVVLRVQWEEVVVG